MFKSIFKVFSKGSSSKTHPAQEEAPPARKLEPAPERKGGVLEKITAAAPTPAPAATGKKVAATPAPTAPKTPEELCGITAKMTKEEIKARLALLYRRFNRASSSLDAKLRAEAEDMLDAIVAIREKTFGPI